MSRRALRRDGIVGTAREPNGNLAEARAKRSWRSVGGDRSGFEGGNPLLELSQPRLEIALVLRVAGLDDVDLIGSLDGGVRLLKMAEALRSCSPSVQSVVPRLFRVIAQSSGTRARVRSARTSFQAAIDFRRASLSPNSLPWA